MCVICKVKNQKLFKNVIHKKNVQPIEIHLCFQHDVELFKRGQESFLNKYKQELTTALNEAVPVEERDVIADLKFT